MIRNEIQAFISLSSFSLSASLRLHGSLSVLLAQHFDCQRNRRDCAYNQQGQPRRLALIFVELVFYQQTNPQSERDARAADQYQFGNGYLSLFQFHPSGPSCFTMRFGSRRFRNLETPALLLLAF